MCSLDMLIHFKEQSMKIEIKKPTNKDLETKEILSWPIWEKEISCFDWHYDSTEECYLLEGKFLLKQKMARLWNSGREILLPSQKVYPVFGILKRR